MAWIACAFLIVILSIALIILFVYGVSVGYYYARKEIMLYLSKYLPYHTYLSIYISVLSHLMFSFRALTKD